MLRKFSNRRRSEPPKEEVVTAGGKIYVVTRPEPVFLSDIGRQTFKSIDHVMTEDQKTISSTFEKVAPYLQEVFTELANHDVRFEFGPVSLDDPRCTMISKNVYSVLCCLQRLPDEDLRVDGDDTEGALSVRLSRKYVQRYDDVCWDDILSAPDSNARRYLSTAKLQQVLTSGIKHAIGDVLANTEHKNLSIKCSIKKHLLIVGVRIDTFSLNFNILPAIEVGKRGSECFAINGKIAKVLKQFEMNSPAEGLFLIAQPVPDYPEKLWRINVNQLENKLIAKLGERREAFKHCLYTINLLNEDFYTNKKIPMLIPLRYIRTSLVLEAMKVSRDQHWRPSHFIERIESVLSRLEAHLNKRQFHNIFTGVNILSGREPATLAEFARNVALFKGTFKEFLLEFDGRRRRTRSLPADIPSKEPQE